MPGSRSSFSADGASRSRKTGTLRAVRSLCIRHPQLSAAAKCVQGRAGVAFIPWWSGNKELRLEIMSNIWISKDKRKDIRIII